MTVAIEPLSARTGGGSPPGEPLLASSSYESMRSLATGRYEAMLSGGERAQAVQILRRAEMR
jgi:hypothetical protein